MPKTNKKVSMNVVHILKSIMDYKVTPLRAAVDAGKHASQEEPVICEAISSLQRFIDNSRYDRSEALEAERELADYEIQASAIRGKINRGNAAAAQLVHADKFYKAYMDTCRKIENAQKIRALESERATLENRLAMLERNMEACEINMTPNLYGVDFADQSRADYEFFAAQYENAYNRLNKVMSDINQLQK